MRLRDEALSHARGLIEPVDDFAGELRSALKGDDWSAFNAGDVPHPEDTEIGACPGGALPQTGSAAERVCVPDDLPELTADMAGDGVPAETAEAFRLRQELVEAEHDRMRSESEYARQLVDAASVKIANWHGCETDPGTGSSAMARDGGQSLHQPVPVERIDQSRHAGWAPCSNPGGLQHRVNGEGGVLRIGTEGVHTTNVPRGVRWWVVVGGGRHQGRPSVR